MNITDRRMIIENFPVASKVSHKTQNGILSVVAGSDLTIGAPLFNLLGASVVGTGYIYGYLNDQALSIAGNHCPWVIYRHHYQYQNENACLIGSGCDHRENFDEILNEVLNKNKYIILDAYGLKRYKDLNLKSNSNIIMTPHLGEFSHLTGLSVKEISANKEELAKEYAKKENVVLVLKDYETIITDGEEVYWNKTGNGGLAKAGSGDLLAGMIAGLVSRQVDPLKAAAMGCYLLGKGAEKMVFNVSISSMNQFDVIEGIRKELLECCK